MWTEVRRRKRAFVVQFKNWSPKLALRRIPMTPQIRTLLLLRRRAGTPYSTPSTSWVVVSLSQAHHWMYPTAEQLRWQLFRPRQRTLSPAQAPVLVLLPAAQTRGLISTNSWARRPTAPPFAEWQWTPCWKRKVQPTCWYARRTLTVMLRLSPLERPAPRGLSARHRPCSTWASQHRWLCTAWRWRVSKVCWQPPNWTPAPSSCSWLRSRRCNSSTARSAPSTSCHGSVRDAMRTRCRWSGPNRVIFPPVSPLLVCCLEGILCEGWRTKCTDRQAAASYPSMSCCAAFLMTDLRWLCLSLKLGVVNLQHTK